MEPAQLAQILLNGNYLTSVDIKNAQRYAARHDTDLTDYLLGEGVLSKQLLGQAIAEYFKVPYADLAAHPPSKEQILKINKDIAKKFTAVLYEQTVKLVTVATDNPKALDLAQTLGKLFPGRQVVIAYALTEQIEELFPAYEAPLTKRLEQALSGGGPAVAGEVINQIFEDALTQHASDIHLEPQESEVLVRFRTDGVLHLVGRLPKDVYGNVLSKIKIQARLRIDEHFAAQDGAIRFKSDDGTTVDMRISIVPTQDGETLAIRLLLSYIKNLTMEELGLSEEHQATLTKASKLPFGMILVTGPTGSGKTTTLYALIKMLNQPEVNITTIEDPVEYKISRINQIQVNLQTNLTFAKGLRSIVRQDPNIILVGEIRDLETAEIAINAALTGHLLLSTLHTNDAATALPRLLDMGIEPFMLASTLELVVAQRLVRKICGSCRVSYRIKDTAIKQRFPSAHWYFTKVNRLYKGKGCPVCGYTGYHGRTALFEMIHLSGVMRDLILTNPSVQAERELAIKEGDKTMIEDGVEKVNNGVTTIEELVRVALPPNQNNKKSV